MKPINVSSNERRDEKIETNVKNETQIEKEGKFSDIPLKLLNSTDPLKQQTIGQSVNNQSNQTFSNIGAQPNINMMFKRKNGQDNNLDWERVPTTTKMNGK